MINIFITVICSYYLLNNYLHQVFTNRKIIDLYHQSEKVSVILSHVCTYTMDCFHQAPLWSWIFQERILKWFAIFQGIFPNQAPDQGLTEGRAPRDVQNYHLIEKPVITFLKSRYVWITFEIFWKIQMFCVSFFLQSSICFNDSTKMFGLYNYLLLLLFNFSSFHIFSFLISFSYCVPISPPSLFFEVFPRHIRSFVYIYK